MPRKKRKYTRHVQAITAVQAVPKPQRAVLLDLDVADLVQTIAALDGRTTSDVLRTMAERARKGPAKL